MKHHNAIFPCIHCTNDDSSMIEETKRWPGKFDTVIIALLCAVCGKSYVVIIDKAGKRI